MNTSLGRMTLVWVTSAAIVLGTLITPWIWAARAQSTSLKDIDTLVLGTSLVRYGVPNPDGGPDAHKFGPKPFLRLGYSRGNERQLLSIVTNAAEHKIQRIYLEVNPIVSRFADTSTGCGPTDWITNHMTLIRKTFRAALFRQEILGVATASPLYQSEPFIVDELRLSRLYPLRVTGPCFAEQWSTVFETNPEIQVILVAMPRAPIARERIGIQGMTHFYEAAQTFAAANNLPLFIVDPSGNWPANAFVDQAHLSQAGAEQFMTLLAAFARELP